MLKSVKRQIKELLHTLMDAEAEIKAVIEEANADGLVNFLADAQEAAVAIGNKVEESGTADGDSGMPEGGAEVAASGADRAQARDIALKSVEQGAEIIALLERYCELLWQITQARDIRSQLQLTAEAWGLLGEVDRALAQIPEQVAVVFMPYKASMWDCMESVWRAACEDSGCVPFVVPIPYFDLKDGVVTARHYEGDMFPEYVPVADYSSFPLAEIHPGAIFVHNPFDDCNIVTTVLPEYYSGELKKVTDTLVYIPYFITTNGVFVTHRFFPSYLNYDFIVVHDEKAIDSFSADLPREKFLPYGSTIAERILRLEREKPAIPKTWQEQLPNGRDFGGNRVVMLNTSISLLMKQRERFLNKIEYLFEAAKQRKGIALVWRPHPLLMATAQTMGEEYAIRLAQLEEKFRKEEIGILDKTPDVGITVALCDAYLGETASSVIQMFAIAGKPRFYINLVIPDGFDGSMRETAERAGGIGDKREEAACAEIMDKPDGSPFKGADVPDASGKTEDPVPEDDDRFVSAWCQDGGMEYYVLDKHGWIVAREKGSGKFTPLVQIPGRDIVWGRAYRGMEKKEEGLLVYPENAEGIFIYHTKTGRMRKVFGPQETAHDGCRDQEYPGLLAVDEECLSVIKAERFKRGNKNHEWYEGDESSIEDYFRFLETAEDREMISGQWPASMEGTGKKVLQAVKEYRMRKCSGLVWERH